VDWVTIFGEDTPVELIEVLRPDVHCKGEEYREPRGKPIPEAPIVRAYGGRVEFVPHFMERSSTGIIEGILRGRCGG
jgi:D-beta-D-heptose 7-phosphate kinase/D-beta-D-heptose 1-phosphate adenosyltransferase